MTSAEVLDTVIIGAGVIGAATAYALRDSGREVYLLEAADRPATGMTSRNSGVIHAGIYYPRDSHKTRLCREGAERLYEFAAAHGVAHLRPGKFIVANSPEESACLDELKRNAAPVPLHEVDRMPPGVRASRALFSPNTGLVEIHALVDALLHASGAEVVFHQEVAAVEPGERLVDLRVAGENYRARRVVNCAGLAATRFAPGYRHHMAQGAYFQIKTPAEFELPHLVYPAVPKGSPGLGVHLTRNLVGEAYLGPDVTWMDRESYAVDPGAADGFWRAAVRFLPWLEPGHLQPGYAGIRAKLSRDGFSDFTIVPAGGNGQLIHCLGIESPGLTAALAIGEYVARLLPR